MVTLLSVDRINISSPYKVAKASIANYVTFTTDFGVEYVVGFDKDDLSLGIVSYQLMIINSNKKKSPRDKKLRDTIIAIVENFFYQNNEVMLYICETGDRKQAMRSRLFEYWYTHYSYKKFFTYISSPLVDEEGVVNYAAIILRNDHPHYSEVIRKFTETIRLLSEKPNEQ